MGRKKKDAPTLPWPDEYSGPNYEWPVLEPPSPGAIALIARSAEVQGGRAIKEAHADRYITMPMPAADGESMVNRKVARCECRRRAQVAVPHPGGDPLRVCVICDGVNRWPTAGGGTLA